MKLPDSMKEQYREAKKIIEKSEDIKIYSHIDCDGICSGAILSTILDRQNKSHDIDFVNIDKLETIEINNELTIFSDMYSLKYTLCNFSLKLRIAFGELITFVLTKSKT